MSLNTFEFYDIPKIESTLLAPSKLTLSENLRCLNLRLMVGAVSQNRSLSSTCFVIVGQTVHSGKFKHLKYSENVNFEGTNSVDSILEFDAFMIKTLHNEVKIFSKNVLCVSLGQRVAKLQVVKFEGLKKNSAAWTELNHMRAAWIQG